MEVEVVLFPTLLELVLLSFRYLLHSFVVSIELVFEGMVRNLDVEVTGRGGREVSN